MPAHHTHTARAILRGDPTSAAASRLLQRRIADALEWLSLPLSELADACGRSEPAIAAEIARMRAGGYEIVFERTGREYRLRRRPGHRNCIECGARLRAGNPGQACDPCGGGETPLGGAHHARAGDEDYYLELGAAMLAVFAANANCTIDVRALLEPPFTGLSSRVIGHQVRKLRNAGHEIEGVKGRGYIYRPANREECL